MNDMEMLERRKNRLRRRLNAMEERPADFIEHKWTTLKLSAGLFVALVPLLISHRMGWMDDLGYIGGLLVAGTIYYTLLIRESIKMARIIKVVND